MLSAKIDAMPKARSLIVAPRLPERPKVYGSNPWDTVADIVADCDAVTDDGKKCGWHAVGARWQVKLAYDAHRKMYHSDQIGVVLLNQPGQ